MTAITGEVPAVKLDQRTDRWPQRSPRSGPSAPGGGVTASTSSMAASRAAPARRAWMAQTRIELLLTLRRGESVLLTFLIPVALLAFFATVDVLPTGTEAAIDFLLPGVLALAIMSTSLVSVAIATGFERQMGVLKRLGATPLGRGPLLAAKTTAVVAIQVLQVVVLVTEGVLLGYRFDAPALGLALVAAVLATVAFAGLGLLMAGTLPALTTLAARTPSTWRCCS
jgi:ABC-2 type transport system permease protein